MGNARAFDAPSANKVRTKVVVKGQRSAGKAPLAVVKPALVQHQDSEYDLTPTLGSFYDTEEEVVPDDSESDALDERRLVSVVLMRV